MNLRIKEIRIDANLSMRAFAERIGISSSAVALIETGKNNPSEQTVRAICSEFKVFREWLETGEGPKYKTAPAGGIEQELRDILGVDHPFAVACLSALAQMPPQWWELFREELYKKVDEVQKKSSE
jgi:transcriptional regulator with XRE-family HTH domain